MTRLLRPIRNLFYLDIFLLGSSTAFAQCFENPPPLPTIQSTYESKNGYTLPATGIIRVLVVFGEIIYDVTGNDPIPNGTTDWPANNLPIWKNDLFDVNIPSGLASGYVTKYYQMASSGQLMVLGDYLVAPTNNGIFQAFESTGTNVASLCTAVNATLGSNIVTSSGFASLSDFDMWQTTGAGLPKINASNNQYDCVIYIWRNKNGFNGNGNVTSGPFPWNLLGYNADTRMEIGSYDGLPGMVARHEFAHLLFGGNNFHAGYEWGYSPDYWIPLVGGWSALSLYGGSLLCWNAWDRQRLGWKPQGNVFNVSARDALNTFEIDGDLDPMNSSQAGIYYLRDFVTTGDALRIKIPFLDPATEYPEYIWIENHATVAINNCEFDQWSNYNYACATPAVPGLYSYMQIDRNVNESNTSSLEVFSGNPLYLRPITAEGFFDKDFDNSAINNTCNGAASYPFTRTLPNPLTGGGDQEAYAIDYNLPYGSLEHIDQKDNWIEFTGTNNSEFYFQGHSRNVFTLSGNKKIGMGTNPSSASMMNMAGYDYPVLGAKNIRRIYLNDISVEILNQYSNGDCMVRVRFDDVDIDQDVRWCANGIELNPIQTPIPCSLFTCS